MERTHSTEWSEWDIRCIKLNRRKKENKIQECPVLGVTRDEKSLRQSRVWRSEWGTHYLKLFSFRRSKTDGTVFNTQRSRTEQNISSKSRFSNWRRRKKKRMVMADENQDCTQRKGSPEEREHLSGHRGTLRHGKRSIAIRPKNKAIKKSTLDRISSCSRKVRRPPNSKKIKISPCALNGNHKGGGRDECGWQGILGIYRDGGRSENET